MILLSAQPDDYYFLWQLELQLFNFSQHKINPKQIHILIGYNPKVGLKQEFKELIKKNTASFYTYPDNRVNRQYPPSIRPHIIKKHLMKHQELSEKPIFYHDSDILFRALPNFENLSKGNTWYVSDTHSYINSKYIIKIGGEKLFYQMCQVVGIDPEVIKKNDNNAGGAQYMIKRTDFLFWDKIEKDSESLYYLLERFNKKKSEFFYKKTGKYMSNFRGIQSWCADMWALLWNAWLLSHRVIISQDLKFSWPYLPIEAWRQRKIIHYAGQINKTDKTLFFKGNYVHYPPYYDDFSSINKKTCSYPIIKTIENYLQKKRNERDDLSNVTFLITVRIDSEERMENLSLVTRYIDKYFNTNIIVLEVDQRPKIKSSRLPTSVKYFFKKDSNKLLHRTKYNNKIILKAETPIVIIYDADVVLPINQIKRATKEISVNNADCVTPYNGIFYNVDSLFKVIFGKLLDPNVLLYNIGKFIIATKRSFGGASFLRKDTFLKAGLENQNIDSWGPEDIERVKRLNILGYKTKRIDGPLFHLSHPRGFNSGYTSEINRIKLMEEYLKVCNMSTKELKLYINTWKQK